MLLHNNPDITAVVTCLQLYYKDWTSGW